MAIAGTKRSVAETTTAAIAVHDVFAGREHQIPPQRENLHTSLCSVGDLTIYEINLLCEFIVQHHGEISSFLKTAFMYSRQRVRLKCCPSLEARPQKKRPGR